MGLFYASLMGFVILISTFVMNTAAVTFMTLVFAFVGPVLSSLFKVSQFTPFGLSTEASFFPRVFAGDLAVTIWSNLLLISVMFAVSVVVANRREIIHYK
jgi:hypothetical protein